MYMFGITIRTKSRPQRQQPGAPAAPGLLPGSLRPSGRSLPGKTRRWAGPPKQVPAAPQARHTTL